MRCFRASQLLLFAAKDLREKLIFERKKREILKKEIPIVRTELGAPIPDTEEITDDDIAKQLGFIPSSSIDLQQAIDDKATLQRLIAEQRSKVNANREAFQEWQAGQREKGAAVRLHRQGLKAERYKRSYLNSAGSRLMSVAFHSELGDNTNNDVNAITNEHMVPRRDLSKLRGVISARPRGRV